MGFFLDRYLDEKRGDDARRAIDRLREQLTGAARDPKAEYRRMLQALDGPGALLAGTVVDGGDPLRISLANESRHEYIGGTSGSGKTRALLNKAEQGFAGTLRGGGIDADVLDPKGETFLELQLCISGQWLKSDEETKQRIPALVYVVNWTKDRITPVDPLDISGDDLSPAYAAELHTRITIKVSDLPYTESLRQLLFMWDLLLIDLKYPDLYPFTLKFFTDAAYRATILSRVKNPDVRFFFSSMQHTVAKATVDAFLRRKWANHAFPAYRYATCIPPSAFERLHLRKGGRWTIANFASSDAQPESLGRARFRWYAVKRLRKLLRRKPTVPLWFVLEELLMFVEGEPELLEILNTTLRTARSAGVAIKLLSQHLIPVLPRPVVETILLNTQMWSIFNTRPDEADLLYPHVLRDPADVRSEGERKRAFLAEMQSLPRQHFYFYAKGHSAVRCKTPDLVHPTVSTGRSQEELLEIFDREIASHSMITFSKAASLIDEWQREFVGEEPVTDAGSPPREGPRTADELRDILRGRR